MGVSWHGIIALGIPLGDMEPPRWFSHPDEGGWWMSAYDKAYQIYPSLPEQRTAWEEAQVWDVVRHGYSEENTQTFLLAKSGLAGTLLQVNGPGAVPFNPQSFVHPSSRIFNAYRAFVDDRVRPHAEALAPFDWYLLSYYSH